MKRSLVILVPSILLAATVARAETDETMWPMREPAAPTGQAVNLCEHRAVREVARIDRDLAPVKEIVSIATNPTGFALKQVNDHVVHIPAWVNIAMDPRGYARNKAIGYVREEAKKKVGVDKGCVAEGGPAEA